ncbi:hypothetical protein GRS48_13905 [Halorubrum sp. JWXQ-INN 858]|uniref:hypothetical protein n=1 Tax=Halorubrum sp. JWXQ-INN 858 TaxID=2690782 RepID=UPI00135718A4|nr:hypothetical protein [Halorubrum sp. JWXQ-INN 858]MWV65904.1 hypothetical protein [Halorubrum sp. JWXQ-INN 858]
MTNQATQADTGFRNHRVEFVREDAPGVTPDDPDFELFSDTLETALVWSGDANVEAQRGLGDYEIQNHFTGAEDHSVSVDYHLQRFFVDGSGNPLDPAGDALVRNDEGGVRSTHTVVDRAQFDGERTYVVARGAYPNLSDLSGDPSSGLPMVASLEYEAKRARMFRVEQPIGEALTVRSTSASDTSQTLTIEGDGGVPSEDVMLDGTTGVTTEDSFDSIDAFELDSETTGDVVVEDSAGDELFRLRGEDSYDGSIGDLGVPALGDGSHADALGGSYEHFLDDYISKDGGKMAAEVRSASFSVSNNYDKTPVMGTAEQAIHIGEFDVEFSASVAGNFAHHENLTDHLEGNEFDLVWELDGGDIVFKNAVLGSPGDVGPSAGDVISTMDNGFEPKSIEFNAN